MLVTALSALDALAHPKHEEIGTTTVSIFLDEEMGLTENK